MGDEVPGTTPGREELLALAERTLRQVPADAEGIVRVEHRRHGLARFANSAIHQHVHEDATRVSLRLARDGRVVGVTTTAVDDGALDDLAVRALELVTAAPTDEDWPGVAARAPVPPGDPDPGTAAAGPAARVARVRAFVTAGSDSLDAAGYVDTEHVVRAVATSGGQAAAAASTRASVDGIHRSPAGAAGSAHQTGRRVGALDAAAAGARAARLARRSRGARDLEPGTYPVVLAPEAVATIMVFLGYYGFSAKLHQEDQSVVRLGADQFDGRLDLVDDAGDPRCCALPLDVEGTASRRVVLLDAGSPAALLHDRRTAGRGNTDSTGHAGPASSAFGPYPRCLVLASGPSSPRDLVGHLDRGLLVTSFNYCRVLDPKTLAVTGLTRNGTFLIEDGRVTDPVRDLRFTQSFADALAPGRILGIGDDDRYADSEFGAGTVIAPTLALAGWRFTGDASG